MGIDDSGYIPDSALLAYEVVHKRLVADYNLEFALGNDPINVPGTNRPNHLPPYTRY